VHRCEERPLTQVAGIVHAAVGRGVDLDHVDAAGTAPGQVAAGLALPARHRGGAVGAVQGPGEDAGAGGLAAAARAGEQVGVVHPVVRKRPLQWLGDVLLADHIGERVRAVAAVQGERGVRTGDGLGRLAQRVHHFHEGGGDFFLGTSVRTCLDGGLSGWLLHVGCLSEEVGTVLIEELERLVLEQFVVAGVHG